METSERIRKLGVVLKAGQTLMDFVRGEVEAVGAVEPDLAGELAAVKTENARLNREVARLEKAAPAAHTDPPSPPPAAPGATGRSKRAAPTLPKYVERRGKKFGCNVQHKDLKFRKGGFATAQEAHDYAVRRIKENGGDATGDRHSRERFIANRKLPRFVYGRNDKFDVLCNRTKMYFSKTGFKTADAASEWAEAEFVRKSADSESKPPLAGSSHANRADPARPQTPGEIKKRTVARRKQWECVGCGHEFDGLDGLKPEICPECRCVIIAAMEGMPGADAVEVRR